MRTCIPLELSRALAIFSLLQMGVTNAYSQVACETQAPLSCGVTNKGSSVFSLPVCQGEFQHKEPNYNFLKDPQAHSCDDHPGFEYATCNATRDWIAANQCRSKGSPYYTIQGDYPFTDGNHCGYWWFTVTCWSGE